MALIKCTECGKEISSQAAACPGCGAPVAPAASNAPPQPLASTPQPTNALSTPSANYEIALLAIPVVGTLLTFFWIGNMNLFQSPMSSLELVICAVVLGTACVAAFEAKALGMTHDAKKGTSGPTAWFFMIVILWVIGYPAYMFKRKEAGVKNRVVASILLVLLYVGSIFAVGSAIETQKQKVRDVFGGLTAPHDSQSGNDASMDNPMTQIYDKTASDAVAQYGIAKRNGSPMDACVQAQVVTAAYLQAKNEAAYKQWMHTKATDCAKAGLPPDDDASAETSQESPQPQAPPAHSALGQQANATPNARPGQVGMALKLEDGRFIIRSVSVGKPAARAGLLVGDIVFKIDGQPVSGLTMDAVDKMLHGQVGSELVLTIKHPNSEMTDLHIQRVAFNGTPQSCKKLFLPASQNFVDSHTCAFEDKYLPIFNDKFGDMGCGIILTQRDVDEMNDSVGELVKSEMNKIGRDQYCKDAKKRNMLLFANGQ